MIRARPEFIILGYLLGLSGCAMVPPEPVVTGPLTAPPPSPQMAPVVPNGSIYQPTVYGHHPLFEDRRPRNVGDIVTIIIQERINATKKVATSTSRDGSASLGMSLASAFLPTKLLSEQKFDASGVNKSKGKGSSSADSVFSSTVAATVIDVLPNGNLRIAAQKRIAINNGSQYILFSGTVDPRFISGAGKVKSTRVANARIAYRSKGVMDEVQTMGWLQRLFLILSPF